MTHSSEQKLSNTFKCCLRMPPPCLERQARRILPVGNFNHVPIHIKTLSIEHQHRRALKYKKYFFCSPFWIFVSKRILKIQSRQGLKKAPPGCFLFAKDTQGSPKSHGFRNSRSGTGVSFLGVFLVFARRSFDGRRSKPLPFGGALGEACHSSHGPWKLFFLFLKIFVKSQRAKTKRGEHGDHEMKPEKS